MQIEEIIRTCTNEQVASAAVGSIGRGFDQEIRQAAEAYGMSLGAFTTFSVERFARKGDESEMSAVRAAMKTSQEPILAGLRRILCIALAAGMPREHRAPDKTPLVPDRVCGWNGDTRREWIF